MKITKTKDFKNKRFKKSFMGLINFYQNRNYKFLLFTFFIWYNNFKNCSKNLSYQVNIFLKLIIKTPFYSYSNELEKNLRLHDFHGRIFINKILFSIAFLKFPFEKIPSIKENLEFIFLKKKPKF
jgi:hypothetical protein